VEISLPLRLPIRNLSGALLNGNINCFNLDNLFLKKLTPDLKLTQKDLHAIT
jgi:hypothetical protein